MATPTQDEIERARALVFGKNGPSELADDIAQALADTRERERERCAKWHDKKAAAIETEIRKSGKGWGKRAVEEFKRAVKDHREASAAIRKGA